MKLPRIPVYLLLACAAWLVLLAALAARPTASPAESRGLYAAEGGPPPYRWTSNRVEVPIRARNGPTTIEVALGNSRWPGRAAPQVALATGAGPLATFPAPEQPRRYRFMLAPAASLLLIRTTIDLPPQDRRWLGVRLLGLDAAPSGLPLRDGALALALLLALLPAALAAAWSFRRGYGALVGLLALALLLRLIMVQDAPPGFSQDEAVSLVDAWHLGHTGRDHLGNRLPLGAQEALGDWISPLLTYLELPLVSLLGPSPLAGRLATALFGALAAPFSYALARRLRLPEPVALLAGLVAAISPWQVFLSRFALPPALVPAAWTVCLWAALPLLQRGSRGDALRLALVAGLALYAYPTLKLAVPLLLALAVLLALLRHGWGIGRRWLPAALLLALLWLPFGAVTLLNSASSTRLYQAALRADTPGEWLAAWWSGYQTYFRPELYFTSGDGDPVHGLPGRGVQLPVEAPLLLLGLCALVWNCVSRDKRLAEKGEFEGEAPSRTPFHSPLSTLHSPTDWWFIAGALLLAPLPASLTIPSPHVFRAATIAPVYALVVGLGAAVAWEALGRIPAPRWRRAGQLAGAAALGAALAWQGGAWFRDYLGAYPPVVALVNQDGLLETMERAIGHAPAFDEVWIDTDDITVPYIYLLAAQPLPPAAVQQQIVVERRERHLNHVSRVGRYRFVSLGALPDDLPALEAVPGRVGQATYVLQEWRDGERRVLLVRRMS